MITLTLTPVPPDTPVIVPQPLRAGAEVGAVGRLPCRATGAPYVRFEWFTRDNTPVEEDMYAHFGHRYRVLPPAVGDVGASIRLFL